MVFFAFVTFGMSVYQNTTPFSSIDQSIKTMFGLSFGNSMRETMNKIIDEPFVLAFCTAIIIVFFASITKVYVVLFMSQFEEHLEENEKLLEKAEEKRQRNKERLLLMDMNDQKTFSVQANSFINFLKGSGKS